MLWLVYKGVGIKQDYFTSKRGLPRFHSLVDIVKIISVFNAYNKARGETKRLYEKLYRRLLHLYRNSASLFMRALYDDASIVIIG
ncbi:transposase [Caldivirga maquilingensis]|uniref:transposase n=1 Tax=Caldivirga maquilingensis TaxID=76887 RepID=UPI00068D8CD5|nr:transposase [Caldivirga maquilingensis]